MPGILEICCTSFASAAIAKEGGANRIELCDNLFAGGTTPSAGLIRQVKDNVDIPLYVLIRPRGGDFVYTAKEFAVMKSDIEFCRESGVDGIVSGVLLPDGNIDIERTRQLVDITGAMDFTFHRAFDLVLDPKLALQEVIKTGATRILTSGLQNKVADGKKMILDLVKWAGNDLKIMAGGGLNSDNLSTIIEYTGCEEFHSTAKAWLPSLMEYQPAVKMNSLEGIPENKHIEASIDEVLALRHILDKNFNCA